MVKNNMLKNDMKNINDEVKEVKETKDETKTKTNVTYEDKNNITYEIININKASLNDLTKLPGIGEAIASKIISYRNDKGNFNSIDDIKNVSGIGEAKFNKIKKYIEV